MIGWIIERSRGKERKHIWRGGAECEKGTKKKKNKKANTMYLLQQKTSVVCYFFLLVVCVVYFVYCVYFLFVIIYGAQSNILYSNFSVVIFLPFFFAMRFVFSALS